MTAKEKVAHRKLSMLQLAEKLRNVSEACRIMGYSRQQFYEIKRSFQEEGFDGLLDKPPIPKSMPTRTPPELEKKVIDLSIQHPARGQQHIADLLALENIQLAPVTVRNIWLRNNLETRYKRMLALEEKTAGKKAKLTEEQIRLLEKHNPEFKERHVESPVRATSSARILSTWGRSRAWAESTCRRPWIRSARLHSASSTLPRSPSPLLICSTTGCCRSTSRRRCQ